MHRLSPSPPTEKGFGEAAKPIIEACSKSRKVLKSKLDGYGQNYVIGDGYYAFIDVEKYVHAGNYPDTHELLTFLGENYGVVVVPGVYFSDAGKYWVRFSYALPPEKTEKAIDRLFEGLELAAVANHLRGGRLAHPVN